MKQTLGPFINDYNHSDDPEPHVERCQSMLKKYPQIRSLMGRNPNTIWYIIGIVALQVTIGYLVHDLAWYWILLAAYVIGAFANHALFVLIHECTHNLVFRNKNANLFAAMLCDIPNGFPTSMGFRKYHLKHHAFQGHYHVDADIPSRWEARVIGRNFFAKAIWLLLFPIFQALRPSRLSEIQFSNKWIWINLVSVVIFNTAIVYFIGWGALAYLFASFFFSVGLHPLGGRWIQEHYLIAPPQETYSYYGPLNKLAFNVGYHNEHHDFSFVPWNNLPKVREIASEYYDSLESHKSWSGLVWYFLTNGDITLFSRTLRDNKGGLKVSKADESDFQINRQTKETDIAVS